ncbi:MAG: lytic transglycosylase domain-containing protein, partial [Paracoccus sp. (in: a-proteobacteria)]|nr:lytic transglycosylase domain-containing protein [Paracoccus sp. (in: a-proteobacteria)]
MRDMLYAGLFAVLPLAAPAQAEDAGAMALALAAADSRDWVTARNAALRAGPLAEALVGWQALRAGYGSFGDYADFLRENPGWPGLEVIHRQGEAKLRAEDAPEDIRDWFKGRHPTTLSGLNALGAALPTDQAETERALFFTLQPMTAAEETALLAEPDSTLTDLIPARATAMLDAGEWAQAERLIDRLSPALQPLVRARVALQSGREGVDDLILALPESQRSDAGLTMDRFLWRVRAKMHDGAQDLMLQSSTDAKALRVPDRWAQMRVDYSRLAMRQGKWQQALDLAGPHFLEPDNRHYSDLEWLAGFAALKTDQPQLALDHFLHLETVVGSAISKARAFYWQARAHQALDDTRAAQKAFRQAAGFPGVYYGQLAMEQVDAPLPADYAVTGPAIDTLPDWRGSDLRENGLFRAGLWLIASGRRDEAQRFLLHLAQSATPEDIARMSRLMFEAGAPWHALRLAKQSANQGVNWPAAEFALTGLVSRDLGPPP